MTQIVLNTATTVALLPSRRGMKGAGRVEMGHKAPLRLCSSVVSAHHLLHPAAQVQPQCGQRSTTPVLAPVRFGRGHRPARRARAHLRRGVSAGG